MPRWALDKYPALGADAADGYAQHGVHYDIDEPHAAPLLLAGLRGAAGVLGCHRALGGWIIAKDKTVKLAQMFISHDLLPPTDAIEEGEKTLSEAMSAILGN